MRGSSGRRARDGSGLLGALDPNSSMRARVQPGLQALASRDRQAIDATPPDLVRDSLDLDLALAAEYPNEARWDYLIGIAAPERNPIAIEIHPATEGEVDRIIEKKRSAQPHLRTHLRGGARIRAWYWVASGKVALPPTGSGARRLAAAGVRLAGRTLALPRVWED